MVLQDVEQLVEKRCRSCEGGGDRYAPADAAEQLKALRDWRLSADGNHIHRDWQVRDFLAGIDFFNQVAKLAEAEDHHPDLHLEGYRNVRIELSTHSVGGLSENDFILAAKIDRLPVQLRSEQQ